MLSEATFRSFRAALGERAHDVDGEALRSAASALVEAAQAELSDLEAGEVFLLHVARHVCATNVPIVEALGAVRAGDLLLASACAAGDARAIAVFLGRYRGDVLRAGSRMRASGVDAEDLVQELSRRAFSPPSPKVAEYSGRGDLRAWVRIVATRLALDIARIKKSSERATEMSAFGGLAAATDAPELAYFRRLYGTEVSAAIEEAARALAPEERTALRNHYVLGMSIDDVAAAENVHRATAARRIQHARTALTASVRRLLDERHGLAGRELVSVMNLVRSQLNITMSRVLG